MAKAKLPKVSCSTMPPYSGRGSRQQRIVARFRPVESAAVDDDAAHRVAVAADELCQRVDDDVGAVFDRAHEVGRRQRVVDDQRQAVLVGEIGERLDVDELAARIGEALDEDELGLAVDLASRRSRCRRCRAQRTSQPKLLKAWPNWLIEPP